MSEKTAQENIEPSQRSTAESLETLLGEVAGEYFDRMTRGERPEIEDYVARYPEIAEQIRSAFPALQIVGDSRAGSESQQAEIDLTRQKTLGDFRILSELGRGGMGVVYEAEQLSMGRKVALKVLPFAALAQEKSLHRFRNEVRAAGALNHPNIVPIHAVGEERGVHFFAMQLIRGQTMAEVIAQLVRLQTAGQPLHTDSISQALSVTGALDVGGSATEPTQAFSTVRDEARISTEGHTDSRPAFVRSAVRLGVQAAEALQHAHDEGVLHRDIKPGNLMLDAEGQLYITDFGLARIETDVGVTMTGDLVGTLRYMSPEQVLANRIVIDHRSDIYSLGVTLYELLTLRPPFDGENRQELLKQIAFEDPPKPCQISRSIPRELETIILKAIEKNPDERYATAIELSEDLQAFLEDRPIKAKPPTLFQRSAKWSRRHKPLVWSASLSVAFLMVAGLVLLAISNLVITEERNQKAAALAQRTAALSEKEGALAAADENFEKVLEAVDQMLARVATDSLKDVPQMKPVQAELLQDALTFYETLLEQDPGNLTVRYRMAEAQGSLGYILGSLERRSESEVLYRAAIAALDDLIERSPHVQQYRKQLASSYNMLGWLLRGRGTQESDDAHRSAAAIYEALLAMSPEEPEFRWQLAHSYQSLARNLDSKNQLDAAEMFARQAIGLFRDSDSGCGHIHAAAHLALAQILRKRGDHQEADTAYVNAIRFRREYLRDAPPHASEQHFLADMLLRHGTLLNQLERNDQAQQCYTEACDIWSILAKSFPNAPAYSAHLSGARRTLAALLNSTGQTAAANQLLVEKEPTTAGEYATRARHLKSLGPNDEAFDDYQKAVEFDPNNWHAHHGLCRLLLHTVVFPNSRDVALKHAKHCVELRPDHPISWVDLAWAHEVLGHLDEAWKHNEQAIEINPATAPAYAGMARIQQTRGNTEAALKIIEKGLEVNPSNSEMRFARGGIRLDSKDYHGAIADYSIGLKQHQASHIYKRRALAHFRLNSYDQALADLAKAVELNAAELSCLTWIPVNEIADCPNNEFRIEFLKLVEQAVELNERSERALCTRALILVAFGQPDQSLRDLKTAASYSDASYYTSYQAALLGLHLDDRLLYQAICEQMLAEFADSEDLRELHFTAWTCALAPDAIDDYAAAIELARQTVEKEPDSQQYLNGLGAILMRSGQYAAAKVELDKALAATESGNTSAGYIRYFLAMTEHHLGRQQEAQDQLRAANESAEEELAESPRWNRKLTLELLRGEAEALIGKADEPPGTNAKTSADPATPPPALETADN